jgi:micrococcal nuclease
MNRRSLCLVCVVVLVALAGCGGLTDTQGAQSPDTTAGTPTTDTAPGIGTPAASPTLSSETEIATVTVIDVVDGDTIDVRFEDGSTDRVRLLGVDTPEIHTDVTPGEFEGVPDTATGRSCLRDWGERASGYAQDRLAGATVTLYADEQADRRGGFDRLLAYVVVDGQQFNYDLVREGYARVFETTFTQSDRFADAEAAARQAGRNLWECRSRTPTDAPSLDGEAGLAVVEIHEDASGNDQAVWNNGGDTVFVYDDDGTLVVRHQYG